MSKKQRAKAKAKKVANEREQEIQRKTKNMQAKTGNVILPNSQYRVLKKSLGDFPTIHDVSSRTKIDTAA